MLGIIIIVASYPHTPLLHIFMWMHELKFTTINNTTSIQTQHEWTCIGIPTACYAPHVDSICYIHYRTLCCWFTSEGKIIVISLMLGGLNRIWPVDRMLWLYLQLEIIFKKWMIPDTPTQSSPQLTWNNPCWSLTIPTKIVLRFLIFSEFTYRKKLWNTSNFSLLHSERFFFHGTLYTHFLKAKSS